MQVVIVRLQLLDLCSQLLNLHLACRCSGCLHVSSLLVLQLSFCKLILNSRSSV